MALYVDITLKLYRLPYCFINNSALEQAIVNHFNGIEIDSENIKNL